MTAQKANPRRAARSLMAAARQRAHQRYMFRLTRELVDAGHHPVTIQTRLFEAELAYRWFKGAP